MVQSRGTLAQKKKDELEATQNFKKNRYEMLPEPSLLQTWNFVSRDIGDTFWKPDESKGEKGLLEALHIRSAANTTHILLQSRPEEELARNFSLPSGELINLDSITFKLSRTAQAFGNIDNLNDDATIRGRDIKAGMIHQLPSLHTDDFYLVKYRDYTTWAVANLAEEARRDSFMGPKYVERCFAVKVGQNAGVLIPISFPQLIFGWEILEKQRIDTPPSIAIKNNLNLNALNRDQFRSLGVVSVEANAQQARKDAEAAAGQGTYEAPHPWDWTPGAIAKRINHYLEEQYRSVGRVVVKTIVVGGALLLAVYFIRRGLGLNDAPQQRQVARGGRRGRSSHRRNEGYYDGDENEGRPSGGVIGSVVRGVFSAGPKQVLDFVLTPSQ